MILGKLNHMSALPSPVQTKLSKQRRPVANFRPHPQSRRKSNIVQQQKLLSVVGKIVIYSAFSILGVVSLVTLTKYNFEHQSKLNQLQSVIKEAEQRTQLSNENFQRSFGTHRSQELMQENSYKIGPGQQPIIIYHQDNDQDR
jgi:hypothetical protein